MMVTRPLFKGVLHAFTALLYIIAIPYLAARIPNKLRWPIGTYLVSIISHLVISSCLHLTSWSPGMETLHLLTRRLDHIMIFLAIAATYYAAIVTVLNDISRFVIYFLSMGIILGIITRVWFTDAPQIIIALPYIMMGWALMLDTSVPSKLLDRLPVGSMIALFGGISYTIGALIYAMKYPNPYPMYIGFHELFHICSTIGTILFTIVIFNYAIPYYINTHNKEPI